MLRETDNVKCVCVSQKDPMFQQFVILVSLEGLENKYSLELSRGKCVLCVYPFLHVGGHH